MRVLWLSPTPSLYDSQNNGGWVESLEVIVRKYLYKNIELAIAFEYQGGVVKKSNNVTYYPVSSPSKKIERVKYNFNKEFQWKYLKNRYESIINDFSPDIIQCFGSEWIYGKLVEITDIPIVIHMQGFLNVYHTSSEIALDPYLNLKLEGFNLKNIIKYMLYKKKNTKDNDIEKRIMQENHYFMGRTDWDKNIVKYYSQNGNYFYCPEAIRQTIYNSKQKWYLKNNSKIRLITITSGSVLKGNEMILRTASILKNDFNFDFEWIVAGNPALLKLFEKKLGINHKVVNIKLVGVIDASTIVKELINSDIYIHPAIIDNSPNSLCEAQLLGCPIIATNVGGIPQLVEDNKTGILYPYDEPHTLAFKIMDLAANKEKQTTLSKNEIFESTKRHDPSLIAKTLLEIYEYIIDNSKKIFQMHK